MSEEPVQAPSSRSSAMTVVSSFRQGTSNVALWNAYCICQRKRDPPGGTRQKVVIDIQSESPALVVQKTIPEVADPGAVSSRARSQAKRFGLDDQTRQ